MSSNPRRPRPSTSAGAKRFQPKRSGAKRSQVKRAAAKRSQPKRSETQRSQPKRAETKPSETKRVQPKPSVTKRVQPNRSEAKGSQAKRAQAEPFGRGRARTSPTGRTRSPQRAVPPRPPRPASGPKPAERAKPPSGGRSTEGIRLQKVLAAAGIASRRAAEELIAAGRVSVNGSVVRTQGRRVDPSIDRIEVDGERIATDPAYEYVILNKPAGVVTTARDPQGRQTVADLVESEHRLYPVGRLDIDTTGLVLMTNHGELAHRMTHPRYGIERVYRARVGGRPTAEHLRRLVGGVMLEDGTARAKAARVVGSAAAETQLEIVMIEGRKREVRRMLEAIGYPVSALARVGFGPLKLGRLAVGGTRKLKPAEVGELLRAIGL